MTSAELLTDAFGRVREVIHEAVDGLTVEQLAFRVDPDANSIAWLCWHLSRVQDDHLAGAFGLTQVWGQYSDRFGLPFATAEIGYGQRSKEVAEVRAPAELLTEYYDAVHEQTLRLVAGKSKVKLDDATGVTVQIGLGKDSSDGGFGLTAKIVGYLPGLDQSVASDLVEAAHEVCPYSKATRGNIDVDISVKV